LWLAWPAWVAFAVISTGNHYWLDVLAGFVLALTTGFVLRRLRALRLQRA
jgi:membrane-associated phospholipid phosphatase